VVEITDPVEGVCRDPHDDKYLAAAVNSGAAFLVSGDRDLLDLKRYQRVEIVTPQEFIELSGVTGSDQVNSLQSRTNSSK
jgi:predicted nucleic acid-binding protein